jgi:hypothetical protein
MLAAPKLEERRRILFVLPVFVYTFSQASAEEDLLYLPQMWSASACWCCQLASSLDNALRWKPDRPSQETDGCNGSKLPGPQAPASWCTPHHSPPRGRACLSRYTRARRPRHPPKISRGRQDRANAGGDATMQRRDALYYRSNSGRADHPEAFVSITLYAGRDAHAPFPRSVTRPPSPVTAAHRAPRPLSPRAQRVTRPPSPRANRAIPCPVGAQPRIAVGGAKRNLRSPPH